MAGEVETIHHAVPHVLAALETKEWAITGEGLDLMRAIARRETAPDLSALEALRAKRQPNTESLAIRDGVGVITVAGPLFKYADLFTAISAATTYEGVMQDMQAALDNPAVKAILLNIDSPGGQVNGVNELANAIRAASRVKPLEAYVGGQAASAAYWLAAATSKITVAETAILGSIGVRMGFKDTSERDGKSGVRNVEFISSQSPHKAVDHVTPEGQKKIQELVDGLASVFVASVADHRGVSADDVVEKFGAGGVKIGATAVEAGMADKVGSFEQTLRALASGSQSGFNLGRGTRAMSGETTGTNTGTAAATATASNADHEKAIADARREGAQAAQARVRSIMALDEAKGRTALADHIAYNTDMTVDGAKAMLAVAPKAAPEATAPANEGRAKDAAGGLALSPFQSQQPNANEGKKPPVTINAGAIYDGLNGKKA